MIKRLLQKLFGTPAPDPRTQSVLSVTAVVTRFLNGEVRRLSDPELSLLLEHLLQDPAISRSLHGNARFIGSVVKGFRRHGRLTMKQRTGIYNVLERALPHNIVAGLLRART